MRDTASSGPPAHWSRALIDAVVWTTPRYDIFIGVLGFSIDVNMLLAPPSCDFRTEEGRTNRQRLLRCWLELAMWLEYMRKMYRSSPRLPDCRPADGTRSDDTDTVAVARASSAFL